ncbi:MAG: DUF3127 domain-containing protein [Verrucomicrobiota bacterium]
MYETAGKMKWIGTTQTFPSGFSKREFVVTTAHDKYPQDIKFDMVKDKCPLLDGFELGQDVQVSFDIRGREYNGKYFVDLSCWKLQAADGAPTGPGKASSEPSRRPGPSSASAEPSPADLRSNSDFDDDDESPF